MFGAAISGGANIYSQVKSGQKFNWNSFKGSLAEGFTTGAVAGVAFGKSVKTTLLAKIGLGIASGTVGNSINQRMSTGSVNWKQSLATGAGTGIGFGVAGGLERFAKPASNAIASKLTQTAAKSPGKFAAQMAGSKTVGKALAFLCYISSVKL